MKWEKSCGAVLYRSEGEERHYLILHSVQGHYTLCKGHVEGDETEEQTAHREILEETSLTATLIPGFRQSITYSPKPDVMKEVVFFLGALEPGEATPQPEEVAEILFLPLVQAFARLTHQSDRVVLLSADRFLHH